MSTASTTDDYKNSARLASTENIDISFPGTDMDGVTLASGDRILLKDQSVGSQNGLWYYRNSNVALRREVDADHNNEVTPGMQVYIEEGDDNAGVVFVLSNTGRIAIGTTALVFEPLGGGGADLTSLEDGIEFINLDSSEIVVSATQTGDDEPKMLLGTDFLGWSDGSLGGDYVGFSYTGPGTIELTSDSTIQVLSDPVDDNDLARKSYVDNLGFDPDGNHVLTGLITMKSQATSANTKGFFFKDDAGAGYGGMYLNPSLSGPTGPGLVLDLAVDFMGNGSGVAISSNNLFLGGFGLMSAHPTNDADLWLRVRPGADAEDTLRIQGDGKIWWGDGINEANPATIEYTNTAELTIAAASGIHLTGPTVSSASEKHKVRAQVSGSYAASATADFVIPAAGAATVTLPAVQANLMLTVKNDDGTATASPITVDTSGPALIDGAASVQIDADWGFKTFIGNNAGTAWLVIGESV